MPDIATTVPAVLDGLVALATATMPAGLVVRDGPAQEVDLDGDYLAIGHSQDEDEGSVDGLTTGQGNNLEEESYSVHCLLSVATGDVDEAAVRNRRVRAAELHALFARALRNDPTLGGVLPYAQGGEARMGRWSWIFGPSADGTFAAVAFDVDVTVPYLGAT
jgi:hypothetical protein